MSKLPKKIEKSKVPLTARKKTDLFIEKENAPNTILHVILNTSQNEPEKSPLKNPIKTLIPTPHGPLLYTLPKNTSAEDLSPIAHQLKDTNVALSFSCAASLTQKNKADFKKLFIGYALSNYQFDHYKTTKSPAIELPKIIWPNDFTDEDKAEVTSTVDAITMIRDLINTPSNDMTPHELMRQTVGLADEFNAKSKVYHHSATVKKEFPLIDAVGKASINKPGLAEFTWGDDSHPKVTLVGKGITFDSGGMNIKGPSMRHMKGDMGGAANVLGLARIIMGLNLPIRLRVIIPTAHNAINENATNPSDIVKSRKGYTVQIDNTDAEGRLILADALAYASEEKPDLLIDMATLTGAAQAAYTGNASALFTGDTALGRELEDISYDETGDLMQHTRYDKTLEKKLRRVSEADLNHIIPGSYGGMIIAAEFLKAFVHDAEKHIHLDINASTGDPSAAGTDKGIKTLAYYLKKRFKP